MQAFIEKQQQYKAGATHKRGNSGISGLGQNRNYPPRHACDATDPRKITVDSRPTYKVTNEQLHSLAKYHEIDPNNNNIFAGKNLSDNSKITSFYTLKT